jgi:hypothetical protein
MYGVRIYDENSFDHGKLHTFVVMNAVFPAEASTFVSERFDLKGSTVGREVSQEELKCKGYNAVLKVRPSKSPISIPSDTFLFNSLYSHLYQRT